MCQSRSCVVKSSWFLAHLRAILAKKTQGEKSSGIALVNHGILGASPNALARDTRASPGVLHFLLSQPSHAARFSPTFLKKRATFFLFSPTFFELSPTFFFKAPTKVDV